MLNRRRVDSTLYFGVAQCDKGELKAHAWIQSGNDILLGGGEGIEHFKIIAALT